MRLLVLPLALGSAGLAAAQSGAATKPEICDVAAALDPRSGEVTVTWSGGTPPFQVIRGDAPRFDRATELAWLADRDMERRHVDAKARKSGLRYYYQVYDYNSARELFSGPEHSHGSSEETDAEKPAPPDNNYCKGVLRRPVTWK